MPNFGFDIGQEEIESWGKINFFCTAKQNCLKAYRLELNIWDYEIICQIIFYPDWCFNILLYSKA